jgi:hypothetical protein
MQLETNATTQNTTLTKSVVLVRVQQDYNPDGSIEMSAYFVDRTIYPDGATVDGSLIPRQATYPSAESMAQSAANTSGLPVEQINGLLAGYVTLIWGMKAALENPPEPVIPIDLPQPQN